MLSSDLHCAHASKGFGGSGPVVRTTPGHVNQPPPGCAARRGSQPGKLGKLVFFPQP